MAMNDIPRDIPSFLSLLRREGELVEIDAVIDPRQEAAEIHRQVIAAGGPALLFRNIKGSPFPLATNLFGTKRRVELAFGVRPGNFLREVAKLPEEIFPPTLGKIWQKRRLFLDLIKVGTRESGKAVVADTVESPPRLSRLPLLTTWPEDGGPFLTLPLVLTEHPESGIPNLGMYRMQRFDDLTTGFHCQIGKGAGFHLAAAEALNRPLPVTVHLGGPPAAILAAIAPLPENVPELLLGSLVLGERIRLSRFPDFPLPFLADAEFVLLGEVPPHERRPEGPFGDHYGYYSLEHEYPVFHCRKLLHRRDAVCVATVVGKPRQEDFFLGDYLQEMLSPLFPLVMPAVRDLWSYGETGYHSLAAAVVRERYKREAMASAFRILGEGQLSLTKFLLVLDTPLNLRNFRDVLTHVLARCDLRTDLYVFSNLSMDTLDYTGPAVNRGSKGVLLGIGEPIRELPGEFRGPLPAGSSAAAVFCPGCLAVGGIPFAEDPLWSEKIARSEECAGWPLVVVVDDPETVAASPSRFLWTVFTRFEPGADISARAKHIVRNHISYEGPVVIDARMKPNYPGEVLCDTDTKALVERRWREYFPKGGVEMGGTDFTA